MSLTAHVYAESPHTHAKYFTAYAKSPAKLLISLTQSTLRRSAARSGAKSRKVQHSQGLQRTQSTPRKVHPYGGGDALRAPPRPSWSWGREVRQYVRSHMLIGRGASGLERSIVDTSMSLVGDVP
jgi:hypothetical protein